jgi:uncharacterized protein (DUF1800 family)
MATRADVAHLLRRATFGPRAEDVDSAERAGLNATLDALLAPKGGDAGAARTPVPQLGPDPLLTLDKNADRAARQKAQLADRERVKTLTYWWLDRMVQADHQLHEKLTFFWHGHWATSVQKVKVAEGMITHQQTLHRLGLGDFGVLVKAMLRDPALVFWLDGQLNTKQAPNENLARELMELFTLGIGKYTETDVKQGARALTGWQIDRPKWTVVLNPSRQDSGSKTILGQTGTFDTNGLADILLAQPANAEFLATRLWFRYASGQPIPPDTLNRLASAYRPNRDITALLRALFTDPAFGATGGQLVKQPVEWAVGAMRQLGIRPSELPDKDKKELTQGLNALGQLLFDPPSVGGWPAGAAWLTTYAAQLRLRSADFLAARANAAVISALTAVPAAQRPNALARLLCVDQFTDRTRVVLTQTAGDIRKLIAAGLASPEYAVM